MSPLRVLHLVPSFVGGGAERQLAYLATAQSEMGVDTHIGYLHGGPNLGRLVGTAAHLHKLEAFGNHDPLLLLRIMRLIRAVGPSVVQTWLTQMDVFGGLAARWSGIPWVLSERTSASGYAGGWKDRLRKRIGLGASAVIANSRIGLEYWNDSPESTVKQTIHNIVPLDAIAAAVPMQLDASSGLGRAEAIIIAVGRFSPEKNWFILLEALDRALLSRPNAHVAIFGDGPLRASIIKTISGLKCADRIHLNGYTTELWSWLKVASVYVSVSHFEGSSNVLLEAIACNCPIVVSDIPGHREVLSSAEAEYVPVSSPTAVAEAIERVLSGANRRDSTAAAFQLVQQWSPGSIAAEYCRLYRKIRMSAA